MAAIRLKERMLCAVAPQPLKRERPAASGGMGSGPSVFDAERGA